MWSNRFGSLTVVRRLTRRRGSAPTCCAACRRRRLFFKISAGRRSQPAPATDFGALYLGLSFFLILAALLLTVLLFVFGVEQREVGALLALGTGLATRHVLAAAALPAALERCRRRLRRRGAAGLDLWRTPSARRRSPRLSSH